MFYLESIKSFCILNKLNTNNQQIKIVILKEVIEVKSIINLIKVKFGINFRSENRSGAKL